MIVAASLVSIAIWTGPLAGAMGEAWSAFHAGGSTQSAQDLHGMFSGAERVNVFLLLHHAFMLASLGVAVRAFSHKRAAADGAVAAVVGLALFGPFSPVALALEAAMTLYLAVQAVVNHMEHRTSGALQVAAGFALFFIGHLGFFLLHQPGAGRVPLVDVFALVGIVLPVQLLPRPSA